MSEIVPVMEGGLVRPGSMDEILEQIRLLAEFRLPASAAERYEVVVRGRYKVLRKRDRPVKFMIETPKYGVPATDTRLPSEQFYRRTRPTRYDDEHRATAVSTVELKEAFYAG